jgi:hypothetical protein
MRFWTMSLRAKRWGRLKAGLAVYRETLPKGDCALAFPVHVADSRAAARADCEQGLLRFLREAGERLNEQYGIDEFICYFNQGGLMPYEMVRRSMTRFAEQVIPHFR